MKKVMCRIDTWHGGKTHGGSDRTADHTCGRREAVDESGEQPAEQPEGLETMTRSERPRALPKRQRERQGEERIGSKEERGERKAAHCTSFSTSRQQPLAQAILFDGFRASCPSNGSRPGNMLELHINVELFLEAGQLVFLSETSG